MSDSLEYASKADLNALEARIGREIGEIKGQLAIIMRLMWYMAGVLSAIGIKILFFTKWTI
jgi:hypothetical protein